MQSHEHAHPVAVTHPRTPAGEIPFAGDVDAWLIRLEVYTPFDAERIQELEYWRTKSDAEHAAVFRSLLSVLPALPKQYLAKPPLARRFPTRRSLSNVRPSTPS